MECGDERRRDSRFSKNTETPEKMPKEEHKDPRKNRLFENGWTAQKVLGKGLRLQLKDEDKGVLDADDLIGKLKVSLESLADFDSAIFEEALKPQGTLCFWVMWVPSSKGANGKKNDKDATSATSAREPPVLEAEAETEVEATPEKKKKKKKKDNHKAEEAQ